MEVNHIHGLHSVVQSLIDQGRMPIPEKLQEYVAKSRSQLRNIIAQQQSKEVETSTSNNKRMVQ